MAENIVLREIFNKCVESVTPKQLFRQKKFAIENRAGGREILKIYNNHRGTEKNLHIDITEKNLHLVGFGKAVFGMAVELENILEERLKSGILSVPIGTQDKFKSEINAKSCLEIYEGAENNLPDKPAEDAAKHIKRLVKNLKLNDILFVLISGGGSSLLPLPKSPITLDEKIEIVKKLASKGAKIEELNILRISLSELKGGQLADLGKNAYKIISLILSDIVNDPEDLIASGPTTRFENEKNVTAEEILKKYDLLKDIPSSILNAVKKLPRISAQLENTTNFFIGHNEMAIKAGLKEAEKKHMSPVFISSSIEGNVTELSKYYRDLATLIKTLILNQISEERFIKETMKLQNTLKFDSEFPNLIIKNVKIPNAGLCLIGGGEPTVKVTGNGLGGRNQELALRFAYECSNNLMLRDVYFLSAGTDGIDGPTTAAGAIGSPKSISEHQNQKEIIAALENNNTFNFFQQFNDGNQHIITGHTGTNVMDIHILMFPKPYSRLSKL